MSFHHNHTWEDEWSFASFGAPWLEFSFLGTNFKLYNWVFFFFLLLLLRKITQMMCPSRCCVRRHVVAICPTTTRNFGVTKLHFGVTFGYNGAFWGFSTIKFLFWPSLTYKYLTGHVLREWISHFLFDFCLLILTFQLLLVLCKWWFLNFFLWIGLSLVTRSFPFSHLIFSCLFMWILMLIAAGS